MNNLFWEREFDFDHFSELTANQSGFLFSHQQTTPTLKTVFHVNILFFLLFYFYTVVNFRCYSSSYLCAWVAVTFNVSDVVWDTCNINIIK